jgi:ribosomal protein S7
MLTQIKYKSILSCFSNYFVKKGKRKEKVYYFLNFLKSKKLKSNGFFFKQYFLFFFIVNKIRPLVELKRVRKGSKNYTFPVPFKKYKSFRVGLKWVCLSIKKRQEYRLCDKIKNEFNLILNREGSVFKTYKNFKKEVVDNIKYSHYRWK